MAKKRMFSLSVIDTDTFLSMPMSSRLLYYELGMRADDDGFVDNWRKILMFTGLKEDDMKILIAKQYIIPFESGVIVIRHWRLNNYLRNDRYTETNYTKEKEQLNYEENGVYTMKNKAGIPNDNQMDTQYSIDKNRLDKYSIDKYSTTTSNIYNIIEENFGRTLSPIEVEKIKEWLLSYDEEIIKYAIEMATLNNKKKFNYVNGIIRNWKSCGYKTIQDIKDNERKNKNLEEKKEMFDYDWLEENQDELETRYENDE